MVQIHFKFIALGTARGVILVFDHFQVRARSRDAHVSSASGCAVAALAWQSPCRCLPCFLVAHAVLDWP